MTQIEVSFDAETLRKVLLGDKGAEVLLEKVFNQILQAEMTEHLVRAERGPERPSERLVRATTDHSRGPAHS
jgi:hypothetical protein